MGIKNRIRIVPVLLAVALAGCGSDSSGPGIGGGCGSSSASVTGTVTASLNGCAIFSVSTSSDATVLVMTGGTLASPTHVLSLGRDTGRPVAGVYSIGTGATQFSGAFSFEGGSSADRSFVLTSGTVNITASSTGTLSGSLASVTASEISIPANTITISGSFSAKCTAVSGSTC